MQLKSPRAQRWFDRINGSRHMLWLLFLLSFLETMVLPIPIEVVLIPLMIINRDQLWTIAAVVTAGCLAASILGYLVGQALYQSVGVWFIDSMGMRTAFENFQQFFDQYGFVSILALGILPIPFQVAMITAGMSGYPLPLFVLAAVLARGIRYFGLAWLVYRFGDKAREMWDRHALVTIVGGGLVIIAFSLAMQWIAGKVM